MPRPHPPRRHAHFVKDEREERVLSAEEKHELILAHAEARRHKHHHARFGAVYAIGVAATCLVVVSGWWITVGSNLRQTLPGQDAAVKILTESAKNAREGLSASSSTEELRQEIQQAKQEYQKEMFKEELLKDAKEKLSATNAKP